MNLKQAFLAVVIDYNLMNYRLHRPIGKPLLIILGLVGLVILGLMFDDDRNLDLFSNSNTNNQKSVTPSITTAPVEQSKDIKSACVNDALKYVEDNKGKGLSDQSLLFGINALYRVCLARSGLTPE